MGVLNPYRMGHNNWAKRGFTRHEVTVPPGESDPGTYKVLLSPTHRDYLLELSNSLDVVWATTWNHLANDLLTPLLDLPHFPVLHLDVSVSARSSDRFLCWKTDQISAAFSAGGAYAGRRFAWFDDDTSKRDRALFDGRFGKNFHKIVLVNPGLGITRDQVDAVKTWTLTPWKADQ